jgi:CBS domain-containing protein
VNVVPLHAPRLVGDVMADQPISVRVDAGLAEAARLLERHQISGLPVLDGNDALVGVISESDLLRARATAYLWANWETLRVKHLMTTPALAIRRDDTLTAAARRMARHHVSRLVVVAEGDESKAIGVIAISDLLRAMGDLEGDQPVGDDGDAEPGPGAVAAVRADAAALEDPGD